MRSLLHALLRHAYLATIVPESASALLNTYVLKSGVLPGMGLVQLESKVHPPASPVFDAARLRALFEPEGNCTKMLNDHREEMRASGFDLPDNGFHQGKGESLFGTTLFEGSVSDDEFNYLTIISTELRGTEATLCQTGFNYGVSTVAFLCATPPGFRVRSWDIGEHKYVPKASELIEKRFPGRHELIIGDSTRTLKDAVAASSTSPKCDLTFVDGGHTTDVCLADIVNFKDLVKPGTKVFVDDCAVQSGDSAFGKLFHRGMPFGLPFLGLSWVNQCFIEAAEQKVISVVEGDVTFKDWTRHVCIGQYPEGPA